MGMRVANGQQLLFCPIGGGMSDSIYTGSSADDHAGGSDAGVAYGHDPSGGEMAYQFGNLWVSFFSVFSQLFSVVRPASPVSLPSQQFCSLWCVSCHCAPNI
jgi:hypothetical protein